MSPLSLLLIKQAHLEMGHKGKTVCPAWHTAMHSLQLQRLLWIYCPGHARASGKLQADRLASTADITFGLQLGRAEVLRGLRNFLNMDRPGHHSSDRPKEERCGERKGKTFHPPKVENNLYSTRQILELFRGQP